MKALVLGCSHAAGSEMIDDAYGRANSYPMLLAERLGLIATNCSIPGGSNDAMFRIFQERSVEYDVVIACWTGIDRTELWDPKYQTWLPMSHGVVLGNDILVRADLQNYGKQWAVYEGTQQRGHLAKIKNILALNMLAQSKNIRVINIDSFQPVDWPERIQWPASMSWPVTNTTFLGWANEKKFLYTEQGHYTRDAHSAFADYVLENIAN